MQRALVTALTAAAATFALPASAALLADFDTAADLGDFVERGRSSVSTYAWTAATGVGSPDGAVTSPNAGSTNDQNLFYDAQAYDPGVGPIFASVFFQASAATASGPSRNFVGFANNNAINLSTDNGKIGVRVFKNAAASFIFQLQNNTATTTLGSAFNLTDGNWYRITTTVTELAPGSYNLAGELLDFGADGATLNPAFSRTGSANVNNGFLQPDSTWTIGLLNQDNNGGATAFDNLSGGLVPEPATLALCAVGGTLVVSRRR